MKKKLNFSIKKIVGLILFVLAMLVLVVGVPIIINLCYKMENGSPTEWDASAMLGYYGAIIGAIATIITVVLTIVFTKKQIQRESFLHRENEKWSKLENIFLEIIDSINPIEVLKSVMASGMVDPSPSINLLQKYQMNCKTCYDRLNTHLNIVDLPKVKKLIDEIGKISEEFVGISNLLIKQYSDLRLWQHKDSAIEMFEIEKKRPGSFTQEDIAFNDDVLEKLQFINKEKIDAEITRLNLELVGLYESKYRELLRLRGSTFETIYNEINSRANEILDIEKWKYNNANL